MQAFKDSRRKKPDPNPVSMLNLVRNIKENRDQHWERWERTEKKPEKSGAKTWQEATQQKSTNA